MKLKVCQSLILICLACSIAKQINANSYTFATLDVPGAQDTNVYGVNNEGQIVGSFYDGRSIHAFSYDHGTYSPLTLPGTSSEAYGINDLGQIVGNVNGTDGFFYSNGVFSIFDVPGQTSTYAHAVNNTGQTVGIGFGNAPFQAFIFQNGVVSAFRPPGTQIYTSANGINNFGEIVGDYLNDLGVDTGFTKNGNVFSKLAFPGGVASSPNGINDSGTIIGNYEPSSSMGAAFGFIFAGGTYQDFRVPGSLQTVPWGINGAGDIAGWYQGADGNDHGFLASPVTTPEPSAFSLIVLGTSLAALKGKKLILSSTKL